jgi:hypothetical protein
MKRLLLTLLGLSLAISLPAQSNVDSPPAAKLSMDELDELLGPIALYPDALIALILPASTFPSDVVLGARYIASDGDPANVDDKAWDPSVKSLTRYPDTLKWLDDNLEWTTQVGDAFIDQPAEVMNSIQNLRAKARALGNLVDTPQQRIVQDDADIRIIPAQPNYIYEPRYDPEVIYYDRPSSEPYIYFSSGYGVGSWLDYDFDWRRHRLYRGDWHEGWDYRRDADRRNRDEDRYISNSLTNSRQWQPDPVRHRAQSHRNNERTSNVDNAPRRNPSRDTIVGGNAKGHHEGIARPKALLGEARRGETVRRGEPSRGGKEGNGPSPRTAPDNKTNDGRRGHVVVPKSEAPGTSGGNKRGSDAKDNAGHKKKSEDNADMKRRGEAPKQEAPKREASKQEPEKRQDARNREAPKQDTPKHQEAPKREAPKQDAPKHQEAPKREAPKQEAPKHQDTPKRQDAPKRETPKPDAPKHQDAPKRETPKQERRVEAPKREAPKPQAEPAKERGKRGGDKKKDDDKDKK